MHIGTIMLALATIATAAPVFGQERVEAGRYLHDGFYLRGSVGPSLHVTRIETDRSVDPVMEVSGAGLSGDFMVGGTPIAGLVIGGALMGDVAPEPKVEVGDRETEADFESSAGLLAAFVDLYVDPEIGLHFGAAAGVFQHTSDDAADSTDQEETHEGFGGAVFAGYDAWIAPEWSLGGMLRLTGGVGWHDVERAGVGVTEKATGASLAVLFTGLYH